MRFLLKMKLAKPQLPRDYHPLIVSVFKGCITEYSDDDIYQSLYQPGAKKTLSWAVRLDNPTFDGDYINLSSTDVVVTLNITDQKTALVYFASLVASKGKEVPVKNGNKLQLKSTKMLPEREIVSDRVHFKFFSPLCLRSHDAENNKDYYCTVADAGFNKMFGEAIAQSVSPQNQPYLEQVEFDASGLKKIIVALYRQKIPVSIGSVVIKAPSALLNDIYQNGLGARQPSGFGLLGIITEESGGTLVSP